MFQGPRLDIAVETKHEDPWDLGAMVRAAVRDACQRYSTLSKGSFDILLRVAVYEPDPSFLPGLGLRKSAYPPERHDLVDVAVAMAQGHPGEYIRHRVEHQIGD